jgi:2-dehydropantoate 2-reductase
MTRMKIAVMGAGGIGSYVGARLAEAGESVTFVARGAHLAAMRAGGLRIESPVGNLHLSPVVATDDPATIGPVDLVLFAVKLWDTETAAAALAPLVGEGTQVLTLQNGIDSVDLISRFVPRERVTAGVIYISAKVAEPGLVTSPGGLRLLIVDSSQGSPTISAFCEACKRAKGLDIDRSTSITKAIWEKFAVNTSFSAITSLTRAPMGPIMANAESRALLRQLLDESVAVALASGAPVDSRLADIAMANFTILPPATRASMAEDLLRGRRLELNWASGRIHALGQQLGIPTPAHTAAYRALALYVNGALPTA